jgi:phospholipid-transporting ATPase
VTYKCTSSEKLHQELSLACIECDSPNKHLYEFKGSLKVADGIYPINPDQILLRGAKLKNCNWVFGCVIYSGHESKLMMNAMLESSLKQSKVDQLTNSHILSLFAILGAIAGVSTIASVIWKTSQGNHWYLDGLESSSLITSNPAFTFLTFVILYNNLVPISLQVTLEVVRFVQAHFINSDIEMYDPETDTPAMARTSNLNEELGAVRYILSDKTGTLTRNIMEFKQCSVSGHIYTEENFAAISKNIREASTKEEKDHASFLREFFTLLSVCHTVVPELNREDSSKPGSPSRSSTSSQDIKYQAASPDEGALVKGVAKIGFQFTTRTPQFVFINALGREEKYEILNVLEFSSERKRMSVIVRCPDGQIKIFVKGADTVINPLLSKEGRKYLEKTMGDLEEFATLGLRTLCCAYATFTDKDYASWNKQYLQAISMADPIKRDELLDKIMNEAESNLILLGATAVEDKLQEGVPDTIDLLLKAGIKIWILTGDKKETAINIGSSCKLLHPGMPLIVLSEESLEATRDAIREVDFPRKSTTSASRTALIVDGNTLRYIFSEADLKTDFMNIALGCRSVICCRVSPIQKAEIVEEVKTRTQEVTLAIGDGANDVAMIRAANVGVGISGQEGLQAAHSADYAICQFRFLSRLLLVHGAWSLSRLCKLILYSFYKNIALYVIELWFATVCAWSGQTIFERWTIGLYNVFFTAAPPLVMGLFDKEASAEVMMKYPKLYTSQGDQFSPRLFWIWVWSAILHSLALFWFTYFMVYHDALWSSGVSDGGHLVFGNILYTYVVVTVCLKAALETSSWTMFTHAAIWGSIALWFVFLSIYAQFWPTFPMAADMAGMDTMIFTSGSFWMGLFLIPFTTLIIDITYKIVTRTCFQSFIDQVRDLEARSSVLTSPSEQTLLSETARLIRNVFDSTRRKKRASSSASDREAAVNRAAERRRRMSKDLSLELQHGYAFSQEEHGVVPQSQLIRAYDTTKAKPSGE